LKTLIDDIGKDEIRDLDLGFIDTSFETLFVEDRIKGDFPNDPVLFPLIANKKFWYIDDSIINEQESNIAFANTINKFNLPPAVSVEKLFEAIQTDYGLTFSGQFLNSENFKRLYLYFKNEEDYIPVLKSKRIIFSTSSGSGTTPIIFTDNDNKFEYKSLGVDAYQSQVILNITPTDLLQAYSFTVYKTIAIGQVSIAAQVTTTGVSSTILFSEETPAQPQTGGISAVDNEGVYFIEINSQLPTGFSGTLAYTGQTLAGTVINKTIIIPSQLIAEVFDLNKIAPRITIVDFLSGLIKMFNLTIIPLSETAYRFEKLETFYQIGTIRNLTKYAETSNKIERVKVYNEINFEYQKSGTIINTAFRDLTTRGYDYGDLNASFDGDGGKFSVQLPFETLLFNQLKYTSGMSTIATNILMGYNITTDIKPYKNKPILLYKDEVKNINGEEIRIGASLIDTYLAFGNQTTINQDIFSLNFGIENTIDTNQPIQKSLYQEFYAGYLENVFNKNARIIKIKMRLPLSILTNLKLNDRIILRDKRYLINSFTNELTTGFTDFELIQDFRPLILFMISEKTTAQAQSKVLAATELPEDVTFEAIINNFSTVIFDAGKEELTITVTENITANTRIDQYIITQEGVGIQSFYVIQQGAI
jgi:hypothetical protein